MTFARRKLSLGEILTGKVVEILSDDEVVMSFNGDLTRVQNETRKFLRLGERITVVVVAVNPPRFRLQASKRDRIDIIV